APWSTFQTRRALTPVRNTGAPAATSAIECIPVARQLSATSAAHPYAGALAFANRADHAPAASRDHTTWNDGKAAAMESWTRSSRRSWPHQPLATKGRGGVTSGSRKYRGNT